MHLCDQDLVFNFELENSIHYHGWQLREMRLKPMLHM